MQVEWITGGVLLLIVVLAIKMMLEQLALQRLCLAFTFAWAALVALHFWNAGLRLFSGLAGLLPGTPPEVLSFWLVFLFAAAPGLILTRKWLGTYNVIFPYILERTMAATSTIVVALGVPSLVIMTALLMPPRIRGVLPSRGFAGQTVRMFERTPVRLYLAIATPVSPWTERQLLEKRLPTAVRERLQGKSRKENRRRTTRNGARRRHR